MREIRLSGSTRGEWVTPRCRPLSYSTGFGFLTPDVLTEPVVDLLHDMHRFLRLVDTVAESFVNLGDTEMR